MESVHSYEFKKNMCSLRAFENKMLLRIFGHKGEEVM
jgi:hypothetical protein